MTNKLVRMKRLLILFFFNLLNFILPRNRLGNKFFHLAAFIFRHRRLPSKKFIYNDFIFYIKTTDEILNPLRLFVSDKELLKFYIKATIGDKYNCPTIAILENEDLLESFDFPDTCCIKPTHMSGSVVFRENRQPINLNEIKKWFSVNYYSLYREENYKLLKPKIIVEPLIFNKKNIYDYKFFCFKGEPRFVQVDINRFTNHTRKFLSLNWKELDFSIGYPKSRKKLIEPRNFKEMIKISRNLSKHFSFIRVDMYSDGNKIIIGELTNLPEVGFAKFIPRTGEITASELLFNQDK